MEEVTIKPLEEVTDIEGLRTLRNSSFAGGDFVSFDKEFTYEEELVWYRKTVDNILAGNLIAYVALIGDEVVGICEARKDAGRKKHNVSLGILVKKEHRGKGIGKSLLKYTIAKAKEIFSPKNIWLEVVEDNSVALLLYSELGFKKMAELRNWYFKDQKYYNTYIMVLESE